jgi:hypothetical protein
MKTELVVLIPGLLALWMVAFRSLEAALIDIYLPVLLLFPDNFTLPIDGLPDPTFSQCAILPIGVAVCWNLFVRGQWRVSALDLFLGAFLLWQFISDFYNVGYGDAQNLFFDVLTLAALPYICGKALIEPTGSRIRFARRFVWLLFVVSIISIYEFKMGTSLFRPAFAIFFPGQSSAWFTQIRWGFGRIAGPYGHAILMGGILAMGYLVCRWLSRSGMWEADFRWVGALPVSKSRIITFSLVGAILMTLSRGPWLGAMCGLVLASVGYSMNRPRAFKRACILLTAGLLLVFAVGKAYIASSQVHTSGQLRENDSEELESAAYRATLLNQYVSIALEHPVSGWGRAHWPRVPGMPSIDNNYLFIALNSGMMGVVLFVALLMCASIRLFTAGMFAEHMDATARSLHFTLLGVIAAVAVSTATVYLGSQLYPLLFLFLGWAEGCVLGQQSRVEIYTPPNEAYPLEFTRVLA